MSSRRYTKILWFQRLLVITYLKRVTLTPQFKSPFLGGVGSEEAIELSKLKSKEIQSSCFFSDQHVTLGLSDFVPLGKKLSEGCTTEFGDQEDIGCKSAYGGNL